jgi:hypothetical protein
MCKARTTLNMAGVGSFESAQFFFLLTGKIGADKAAHNLVTPKTIVRTEWSLGQTGLLKTTIKKSLKA